MLDTNIFNSICIDDTFLRRLSIMVKKNRIYLLTTYIQIDEINQISDNDSEIKDKILIFIKRNCTLIPTRNLVFGISKFGQARLGETHTLDAIRRGKKKLTKDAMIAATAEFDADFLVTNDLELRKRAERVIPIITLLNYLEFYNATFYY